MLVLQYLRALVQIAPRGQVPGLGRPGVSPVEEDSKAVREERAGDPVSAGDVRGSESDPCSAGLSEGHVGEEYGFVGSSGEGRREEEGDSESEGVESGPCPP